MKTDNATALERYVVTAQATAVDLKFKGYGLGGPWDGQHVNAQFARIEITSGTYDHAGDVWLWTPVIGG